MLSIFFSLQKEANDSQGPDHGRIPLHCHATIDTDLPESDQVRLPSPRILRLTLTVTNGSLSVKGGTTDALHPQEAPFLNHLSLDPVLVLALRVPGDEAARGGATDAPARDRARAAAPVGPRRGRGLVAHRA